MDLTAHVEVISAVIDKSLFHEICKLHSSEERNAAWIELDRKYQLILPLVLVEEILVNAIDLTKRSQSFQKPEIEELKSQVMRRERCWLEDLHEAAFRELILGERFRKFPAPRIEFRRELLNLRIGDASLVDFVRERETLAKETLFQWKAAQKLFGQRMVEAKSSVYVQNYAEFVSQPLLEALKALFGSEDKKREFLYAVFGDLFARRHPGKTGEIQLRLSELTTEDLKRLPFIRSQIFARLAYWLGPIFWFPANGSQCERKIIRNERNNFADEQYVASSLIADRLLTRDKQMADLADGFREAGLWHGQVVYIPHDADLLSGVAAAR